MLYLVACSMIYMEPNTFSYASYANILCLYRKSCAEEVGKGCVYSVVYKLMDN